MIRKMLYTILILLLSFGFVFVNIKGIDALLGYQEHRFLSEQGKMEYERPVSNIEALMEETQETDESSRDNNEGADSNVNAVADTSENAGKYNKDSVLADKESGNGLIVDGNKNKKGDLSSKEIFEVLDCLGNSHNEMVHEPMEGQIAMIDAITISNRWLDAMEMSDMGYEYKGEYQSYINTSLIAIQSPEYEYKTSFSFWVVSYSGDVMSATLYINAVTGEVWRGIINCTNVDKCRTFTSKLSNFIGLTEVGEKFPIICDDRVMVSGEDLIENEKKDKEYELWKEYGMNSKSGVSGDNEGNETDDSIWAYLVMTDTQYTIRASVSFTVEKNNVNYYGDEALSVAGDNGMVVFNIENIGLEF